MTTGVESSRDPWGVPVKARQALSVLFPIFFSSGGEREYDGELSENKIREKQMKYDNRKRAHHEIDCIFKDLLPARGLSERPAQIALSHQMLDAMLDGSIALCDAGTGGGKTFAYLAAGIIFAHARSDEGLPFRPILISTSSIALQKAVLEEYLPLLSKALLTGGRISRPIWAVVRKGKNRYVCDQRLEERLRAVDLSRKNKMAAQALLSLKERLDMDEADHLSGYDRRQVCVPASCDCGREACRYTEFLKTCGTDRYLFQICNHNLLLADAIHRDSGRRPILPDVCALVIDEAHKLPESARQMFGVSLSAEDIYDLIRSLRQERFLLAADMLAELSVPLLRKLSRPPSGEPFSDVAKPLADLARGLTSVRKQLHGLLSSGTSAQLERVATAASLLAQPSRDVVCYAGEGEDGGTVLQATPVDLTARLRRTLWLPGRAAILTSGTLAAGGNFRRFKEEAGLMADSRVTESISPSPFDYQKNCLLYLPPEPPRHGQSRYYDKLSDVIAALLKAAHGHALALFTSYAAMSAVKEQLRGQGAIYPLFTLGRNAVHTMERFKNSPGSALLAAGAAWEGFDFPGDCVSLLIIPRLPFPLPDALKEKEREKYPTLRLFLRAVVVPEMQIKLKQGFGRAIRTETDSCVVAILDERAGKGQRYHNDMLAALPAMPVTDSLTEVERFIRRVKPERYFLEVER